MSLKEQMDKLFQVDEEKISKMASVDIAAGGVLPLPEKGESVTIKFTRSPILVKNEKLANKEGNFSARCVIYGKENDISYDIWIGSTIYKGIRAEFKKKNVPVDDELKCIIGRVITITGKDWPDAPRNMWKIDEITKKQVSPKTYSISLREDLELKSSADIIPEGTAPELLSF